jgi:hypothetical protein
MDRIADSLQAGPEQDFIAHHLGPPTLASASPPPSAERKDQTMTRLADAVAARPLREIDPAFVEQRVTILAGPHADTTDHRGSPSDCFEMVRH